MRQPRTIHLHDFKDEGVTTPFTMTVLNDIDRCPLARVTSGRLPHTIERGAAASALERSPLRERTHPIAAGGLAMAGIRGWTGSGLP